MDFDETYKFIENLEKIRPNPVLTACTLAINDEIFNQEFSNLINRFQNLSIASDLTTFISDLNNIVNRYIQIFRDNDVLIYDLLTNIFHVIRLFLSQDLEKLGEIICKIFEIIPRPQSFYMIISKYFKHFQIYFLLLSLLFMHTMFLMNMLIILETIVIEYSMT